MNKSERLLFGDRFYPQIADHLANQFNYPVESISKATFEQDTQQATDLILPDGCRVANRIRQTKWQQRYGRQFTIRTSGQYSELEKIRDGRVQYMFYGFADEGGPILDWLLLDLVAVQFAIIDNYACLRDYERPQGFESSFVAFSVDGFPSYPELVVASSGSTERLTTDNCPDCRRLAQDRAWRAAGVRSSGFAPVHLDF